MLSIAPFKVLQVYMTCIMGESLSFSLAGYEKEAYTERTNTFALKSFANKSMACYMSAYSFLPISDCGIYCILFPLMTFLGQPDSFNGINASHIRGKHYSHFHSFRCLAFCS